MPLLLCPNDNVAMQEVDRNGVHIDVCPQCRGVWLDRGELEKLLSLLEPTREQTDRPSRQEGPEYREHSYERPHGKRKKKRFELFDFFD